MSPQGRQPGIEQRSARTRHRRPDAIKRNASNVVPSTPLGTNPDEVVEEEDR
jgi:hypothetical protein